MNIELTALEIIFFVCEFIALACSLIVILWGKNKTNKTVLISNYVIFFASIIAIVFMALAILVRNNII